MIAELLEKTRGVEEQYFILPGYYNWQQFKAIQALMDEVGGVRLSYLDGCVEFMTLGENHEMLKKAIAILVEIYFFEMDINFIPVGSATREDENKGASFEPDESYYIGEKKEHPDLAIEVAITSGGTRKLEKYRRFQIAEVWFWQNNQLAVYRLREDNYEQVDRSEFLPELDLELLVRCVLIPSRLEARKEFLNGIRQ
ncbi:Uma2 family endonuclease [Argonema galeatum]|uniref:Uma2 family endonuclease n=1 Tax=Argonema galeatum TaxID=2942762 RepID=UPI002012ABC8|nr:Uma2 family endonuclease [Argonema galeatum]MCL1465188.1 Uma2 family endonuclease [Argonema galeatum A003/A1]